MEKCESILTLARKKVIFQRSRQRTILTSLSYAETVRCLLQHYFRDNRHNDDIKYREFVKKEKISDFFQKALDKFRFL